MSLDEGLTVVDNDHDVPTVRELVNCKQDKRCKKGNGATVPLKVVGMDIGYSKGIAVGRYKYVLILVSQCTTFFFLYGMYGCSGGDICEALWKIFIITGGFPCTIQCDFNPCLIGDKAGQLLRSHGTWVCAAPPCHQYKNGLVENKWQISTNVACSFLAGTHLSKKFWYWALCEANLCSNIFPVSQKADDITDPNF